MVLATAFFMSMMSAVDLTIVSVALPYIAGDLGATPDEILWVLTMFTIAQAVSIGISGKIALLVGRKRLCWIAIVGFMSTSILCGLSVSLEMIVFARFLQGIFSGPLMPTAQVCIVDAFPEAERPKALGIWSIGVMAGPALGPALGGYFAQNFSWNWCFWVNVPIGLLALTLNQIYVRPVPPTRVTMDWLGLGWLLLLVILFQTMLDRGNIDDWWSSKSIQLMAIGSIACAIAFIGRGLVRRDQNIIDITLYGSRNFLGCSILIFYVGVNLIGLLIILPVLMVDVFRWDPLNAGATLGIAGLGAVLSALISSRVFALIGIRMLLVLDTLILSLSWFLLSRVDWSSDIAWLATRGFLLEFALLLVFSPLAARAFTGLSIQRRDEAAAVFNFSKSIGFSVGAAFAGTLIYRGTQANWDRHRAGMTFGREPIERMAEALGLETFEPAMGAFLTMTLGQEAKLITLVQSCEVFAVISLLFLPVVLMVAPSDSRLSALIDRLKHRLRRSFATKNPSDVPSMDS